MGEKVSLPEKPPVSSSLDLEVLFYVNPDLLCISSLEGRFLKVNPQWTPILGWSEEELLSVDFIDFVHPDDVEATIQAIVITSYSIHYTKLYESLSISGL